LGWYLPTDFIPSLTPSVFTDRNIPSINTEGITIRIKRILKNQKLRWHVFFYGCFYRWNYSWIQTGKVIQWRVTFTDKLANGLTDKTIFSVNPSVIVNIWISHWHSPFLFLLLPLYNKTNPPPKKNLQLTALPHPPHHPPSFLDFSNHISNFIVNFLF
jgi:hypothetical protein